MFRLVKIITAFLACFLFLTVKAQLQPDFAAAVPAVCAPVSVQFSDSTKGSPTKWIWYFGNNDTSHQQNPEEIYTKAGIYSVKLVVSNSNNIDSITKSITIIGSADAAFTYLYNNVCVAPSAFSFKATNVQDSITYSWNFGNGNVVAGSNTSTIFNATGSYPVRLITSTPQGCKDTSVKTFAIGSATASFSSYSVVCKNDLVTFTSTSDPIPLNITWYVNGVNAGTGNTLQHIFTTAGNYTVKLAASFGTCIQTTEKPITVKEKPVPAFTQAGNLQSCTYPVTIDFANNSTNADTYKWMFGDGNTSDQTNINYKYNSAGTFSPSLIAFNGDGCSDTLTKAGLIRLGPPVISSFTALPKSGCVPETITSGANITSPDPVTTYDWNTGDASQHTSGAQLSHVYANEGYYTVSLSVTTQNGCTGSLSLFQAVAAGTKPVTDFTVDDSSVCASVPVNFIDKSIGKVSSWNYNFGDGLSASGSPNPSHLFTKIGSNDVTLYVSDKGCSADPLTKKNIVTVLPPIAGFTYNYSCANQLAVQFTDKSVQPLSWQWNFGDGQTSPMQSPLHTYTSSGNYQVILKATNGSCNSLDTMAVSVTSDKPGIVVEPSKPFICRNDSIKLSAVSNSGFVSTYSWNTGDGSPAVNDSTVTHTYTKSNDYKPYVAVQYINKCRDTVYTSEPVHVYGPTAAFTTSQSGNCLPLDVTFTDKSTTDNLHKIDIKKWFYGNGDSEEVNDNTHIYTYDTGGTFTPELVITDAVGCIDSVSGTQPITAKGAVAGFTFSTKATCDSAQVNFANTTVLYNDQISSYSWNFGDGLNQTLSLADPVHTYHTSGTYKATLTVTTQSGCSNTYEQQVSITVSAKPAITITAPANACIAADITASATIAGNNPVSQWQWDLGNGISKNGQSIIASYPKPGNYIMAAIAITSDACSDTAYKKIAISDLPQTNAGSDSFVCAGSTISLTATGADSYTWQQVNNELSCTNCASALATPAAPIAYVVTGKNTAGCTSNDTVFIDVQNKETVAVAATAVSVCNGNSVQLSASGTNGYSWTPGDGLSNVSVANPVAKPSTTTLYSVSGSDSRHCFTDTKQIDVTVDPLPQFNIVDSVLTLSRGAKHTLLTTSTPDIIKWLWQPATGLSCSNCAQPELTASVAGIYTATAYTAKGCSDSDEVKVLLLCDQSGIFIPTAFTPNNDGKNDRFYPKSFAGSKVVSFTIFSRDGMIVYQRQNITTNTFADGWDGSYQSIPLPTGIYIYKLEVMCEKDIIPFSGTVTLIR